MTKYLKIYYPWNKDWWGDNMISLSELIDLHNQQIIDSLELDHNDVECDLMSYDPTEGLYDPSPKKRIKRNHE